MKKIVISLLGIAMLGFVSCNNDNDDVNSDLETIKENLDLIKNQNDALLDSIAVINENIDGSNAENIKKEQQLQRGVAIGVLFESIARNPEEFEQLDNAATQFIGAFDASQLTGDDNIDGQSRGVALSDLFEFLARQPEAFDILASTGTKFLGDYDPTIFSDEMIEVAKAFALDGLNTALARQPAFSDLYNSLAIQFLNFSFIEVTEENP